METRPKLGSRQVPKSLQAHFGLRTGEAGKDYLKMMAGSPPAAGTAVHLPKNLQSQRFCSHLTIREMPRGGLLHPGTAPPACLKQRAG